MQVQTNQLFLSKFRDKTNLLSKNGIIKVQSSLVQHRPNNKKALTTKLPSMSIAHPSNSIKSNQHQINLNNYTSKGKLQPLKHHYKNMPSNIVIGCNVENQNGKTVNKLLPIKVAMKKSKTQKQNEGTIQNQFQLKQIEIQNERQNNSQFFLQKLKKTLDFDSLQALYQLDIFDCRLKTKNISCHK